MSKLTLELPMRYRIDLSLIKRREVAPVGENFIPRIKDFKSWRNGNKLSRFFRHIFEHKNINRVLGSNLAVAALAATMLPQVTPALTSTYASGNAVVNMNTAPITFKTERGVQYPLQKMHINQGYFAYHPGVDLKGAKGDPIKSIMVGTVEVAEYSRFGYGNSVIINHGDGFASLYAHMSKINVKTGDRVDLNTVIGEVGSTGRSTGFHLHLEVRENGVSINPFRILPKISVAQAK